MRKLAQQDHLGNSWPSLLPPTITSPANDASGLSVALGLALVATAATVQAGEDSMIAADWEIRTAPNGGGTLVWSNRVTNILSLLTTLVPALTLQLGKDYYIRTRQTGAITGVGPWSADVHIST